MVLLAVCMTLVIGEPVTKVHMADWRIMLIMMNTEMLQERGLVEARMKMNTFKKETSVRPSLKLTADLNSWLKFTAEGNYNYYYKRNESKELGSGYANEGGYYKLGQYTKEQTNLNASFSWNKEVKDFNISGFIRGEYYHNFQQELQLNTNGGLVIPGQFFIGNQRIL